MTNGKRKNLYKEITERIIESLKKGVIPWNKPWNALNQFPKNLITRKEYSGINYFLLSLEEFKSCYWITEKQVLQKHAEIKPKQSPTSVVFWRPFLGVKKDANGNVVKDEFGNPKRIKIGLLRFYQIYNVEQTTIDLEKVIKRRNIKTPEELNPVKLTLKKDIAKKCKGLIKMKDKPEIKHFGGRACYSPTRDGITMPPKESFETTEGYYATLFHELGHSTGHKKRLNRRDFEKSTFGGYSYSKEELVAEMTAAFLCGMAKIDKKTIKNAKAYIQNWIKVLKNDEKMLIHSAGLAKRATEYILGNGKKKEKRFTKKEAAKAAS